MTENVVRAARPTRAGAPQVLVRLLGSALALGALVVVGQAFVTASAQAAAASADGLFPRSFLGIPLLEGFSTSGRHGVHVFWGTGVVLAIPAIIALTATLASLRRWLT